jgi:glycosyltransferase involved in cell wall biosynthesis
MNGANFPTIVILHPHFTMPGGAGRVALELGKRLAKNRRVVVIAQKINQEYIEAYPEIKFESINGPVTSSLRFWLLIPYWQWRTSQRIDQYARRGEIVIFPQVFPSNWLGLYYKKRHPKIKCVLFCHEPSAFIHIEKWRKAIQSPFKRFLANTLAPILSVIDKDLTRRADEMFVNSVYGQQLAEEIYQRKGVIVYPGVDLERFKPVPYTQKEDYILTVSHLSKFKNIDILIEAFAKLKLATQLYIIGEGEEKENLEKLAKRLEVQDRVQFFSEVSDADLANFYAKAKLFVLCSQNEPFGLVPVEAMASGTPVIADRSGGPMETVIDGKTGRLIECRIKNLSTCIQDMLVKVDLAGISQKARGSVIEKFNWEKSAEIAEKYL